MSTVPEYNIIDNEKDSLIVVRAKLAAISKALKKRAKDSINNPEEVEAIDQILKKSLGEWL